jgi:hypothetical protein
MKEVGALVASGERGTMKPDASELVREALVART